RAVLAAPVGADARREAYDRAVRQAVLTTGSRLKRGLPILATVGATAPFVGLVGTVAGVVNAFHEIAMAGQGGVGQVSGGIAEALVTTAVGIGVAIPAVWLYNYLTQRIGRLLVDLESTAQTLAVETLTGGKP
ncbi:MAG: MotA/TolQ/ExbB proton channel family protein, partial [Candidatus Binatia bacterium]